MNRLSEAAKFLIIAGTILIVCSLVVVGFFVMKEGKEGTNHSLAQFNNIVSNHDDVELEKYHNVTISGNSLRDMIIEKYNSDNFHSISIEYVTLKLGKSLASPSPTVATEEHGKSLVKTANDYINPTGSFQGKVVKNNNGIISKIVFTQTN